MYRGCKLFLSEDGLEVVRVECGVASIPPFRIDIPSSNESIWFSAEMTRVEPDDKVELGEVLGLPRLCYDSKLKGLSNKLTLILSNTRELDRVPNTK